MIPYAHRPDHLWPAIAVTLLALLQSGCPSDPDENDVDMITAASPGVLALTAATHPGWNDATCGSCHEDGHRGVYTVPECVFCHGRNGAPERTPLRDDGECASCHADVHPTMDFASPEDCQTCHHYAQGDECGSESTHDVVVIGAGGGGLSAATTLALEGYDVVVLERHHKVGGSMATFQRGEYNIEASLHGYASIAVEGAPYRDILRALDVWDRLEPVHCDPMFRVMLPEHDIVVPADLEEYRALLKAEFPEEADNIDALFEQSVHLDNIYQCIVNERATGEWCDYIDYVEGMLDIALAIGQPLDEYVNSYISDPELISAFTILTGYAGTPPDSLSAMFFLAMWGGYHIRGYSYFEGGSGTIAEALAEVIEENGGRIELNTTVTEIVIDGDYPGRARGVRTDDGRCFNGRHVVSNAPAPITLFELVGREHLDESYAAQVDAMETSESLFIVYLGLDRDYRDVFDGAHEIFVAGSDLEASYVAMADCDVENIQMVLTNYSVSDPTAAPPGKNVITLTGLLPYDCSGQWGWNDSRDAYLTIRDEAAQIMIERSEALLPDLRSHIEVLEIATPQTIQAYTSNPGGAFIGWANTSDQVFSGRLEQTTDIEGLYLAGAWTFPGGGVGQVIVSGRLAAGAIMAADAEP